MSDDQAAPASWAGQFLQRMILIMALGPIGGTLLFVGAGWALDLDASPMALAIRGAKIVGLGGGFLAAPVALIWTIRDIKHQSSESDLPPDCPGNGR